MYRTVYESNYSRYNQTIYIVEDNRPCGGQGEVDCNDTTTKIIKVVEDTYQANNKYINGVAKQQYFENFINLYSLIFILQIICSV